MTLFHRSLEEFQGGVQYGEREKACWLAVGDVLLEALQDEIDQCKVYLSQVFESWFSVAFIETHLSHLWLVGVR